MSSLTTSLFPTLLNLLESTGVVFTLSVANSLLLYQLANSTFLANCNVSIHVVFLKSDFVV